MMKTVLYGIFNIFGGCA